MIRRLGQDWVQAAEAAELLGDDITPARIRSWGHQGLCRQYRWRSSTWYLWTQLQAVERQTRLTKVGARRGARPGKNPRTTPTTEGAA